MKNYRITFNYDYPTLLQRTFYVNTKKELEDLIDTIEYNTFQIIEADFVFCEEKQKWVSLTRGTRVRLADL